MSHIKVTVPIKLEVRGRATVVRAQPKPDSDEQPETKRSIPEGK